MNPLILKYPFDPDQNNPGNYIFNEPHDITDQLGFKYKCVSFNGGYFFTDTLTVTKDDGVPLMPDIDYQTTHLNPEAVEVTGKSVCGMIVITNPEVVSKVYITGHLVGGKYSTFTKVIQECLDSIKLLKNAPPTWNNITDKPDTYRPSGHFMLWSEMYGFTPFTFAIDNLKEEIVKESLETIKYELMDLTDKKNQFLRRVELLQQKLNYHVTPKVNNHKTTPTDINLNMVDNFPIVSTEEIKNLNVSIPLRYVDSIKGNELLSYWLNKKLTHYHPITLNSLDTYSKTELNNMLNNLINKSSNPTYTYRIGGYNLTDLINNTPKDYPATNYTSGIFKPEFIAINTAPLYGVLCNDQTFKTFESLLDTHFTDNQNLIVLGEYNDIASALNKLNADYSTSNKNVAMFTLVKRFYPTAGNLETISYMVFASKLSTGWKVEGV